MVLKGRVAQGRPLEPKSSAPGAFRAKAMRRKVEFFVENGAPKVDFGTLRKSEMAPKSHFSV